MLLPSLKTEGITNGGIFYRLLENETDLSFLFSVFNEYFLLFCFLQDVLFLSSFFNFFSGLSLLIPLSLEINWPEKYFMYSLDNGNELLRNTERKRYLPFIL